MMGLRWRQCTDAWRLGEFLCVVKFMVRLRVASGCDLVWHGSCERVSCEVLVNVVVFVLFF